MTCPPSDYGYAKRMSQRSFFVLCGLMLPLAGCAFDQPEARVTTTSLPPPVVAPAVPSLLWPAGAPTIHAARTVLVGVTGGIAIYKAVELVRGLVKDGFGED